MEVFETTLAPLRIKNQLNCDGDVALAKESYTNGWRMCLLLNTIATNTTPVSIFRLDFICEFSNNNNKCGQTANFVRAKKKKIPKLCCVFTVSGAAIVHDASKFSFLIQLRTTSNFNCYIKHFLRCTLGVSVCLFAVVYESYQNIRRDPDRGIPQLKCNSYPTYPHTHTVSASMAGIG